MKLILSDQQTKQELRFVDTLVRIGSGENCELRFDATEWPMVRPRHASLQAIGEGRARIVRLNDNPAPDLWLNGAPVSFEAEVRLGDHLQFGAAGPRLILLAATGEKQAAPNKTEGRAGMLACLACGILVSATTAFCPGCGAPIGLAGKSLKGASSSRDSDLAVFPQVNLPAEITPRYRGLIRPPLDVLPSDLTRDIPPPPMSATQTGALPPVQSQQESTLQTSISSTLGGPIGCAECGAEVSAFKAFCHMCGSPMEAEEQQRENRGIENMAQTVIGMPLSQLQTQLQNNAAEGGVKLPPPPPAMPTSSAPRPPAPASAQMPVPPPSSSPKPKRSGCLTSALLLPFNLMTGMVIGPGGGAEWQPATVSGEFDTVDCTVFAPPVVAQKESFLVQVFAHLPDEAREVARIAQEFDRQAERRGFQSLAVEIARGSRLDFHLVMPGLDIDLPAGSLLWRGRLNSVQFGVYVPVNINVGDLIGTVVVSLGGLPIGHIKFKVRVAAQVPEGALTPQPTGQGHAYRRAFLSYAPEDWAEVGKRAQMLASLKIGFDDAALHPERRETNVNFGGIDESDLFLLFWSAAAQHSPLVLSEVAYALHRQRGDGLAPPQIMPVVLSGPPVPVPPDSLAQLDFNDFLPYLNSASAPTVVTTVPAGVDWSNPVGQSVGNRYLVEKLIGQGGFGAVYRARDEQLVARPVVVKFLHAEALRNAWTVNKFQHEIEALARLDHPGIVGILDAGQLPDGVPYLVMQFVAGKNLREGLPSGGMPLREVALVIRQVASALSEAHSQGILHRDLKPENIMLRLLGTGETQAVVIDFGIAKVRNAALAPQTEEARIAGTYLYMSPEQLMGDELKPTSDVYTLGVVAYELLTGARPFAPRTLAQLPEMQRRCQFAAPRSLRPELSENAETVLCKALAYNPAQRYQTEFELGEVLANSLAV